MRLIRLMRLLTASVGPFDSGTLNSHQYNPRPLYELNSEMDKLSAFISATRKKSDGRNEL